ncbi:uncharacterized protein LOC118746812 [Rhagoletis pomonella]|uniref:uncharacterized protein LOC118746812 n=1 Tax=Rhagoletis pomonella TaxID=28610 RepID=UPI00177CF87C|nr:uncharacterized protein LOC118746812 [Rhagoletis pomonella]
MKSKTKKKMSQNKAEYRATGGGPNRLQSYTNIEEAIIGLLELDACVNPPGAEFGLDISDNQRLDSPEPAPADENQPPFDLETSNEDRNYVVGENTTRTPRKKRCHKTERLRLLEAQTNAQKAFYENVISNINEIKKSARETEKYAKRTYYLKKDSTKELLQMKKEKLEIYKSEVMRKQQDRKAKLQLKVALLEMKKKMLPKP